MRVRYRFVGLACATGLLLSVTACGSDAVIPSGTTTPVTTTTSSGGSTGSDAGSQGTGEVYKCSLSERSKAGTCLGGKRPGVGAVGPLAFQATAPTITFTGTPETARMDGYLTAVVNDLAAFWTRAYRAAGITNDQNQYAASQVKYFWIWPGETVADCNPSKRTTAGTMAYCFNPKNPDGYDRMYVAMDAILADWNGTPLPGSTRPHPKTGEWSAIYTLAHEYGHNLQEELGVHPALKTKYVELEADCLAGVYMRGSLDLTIANNLQGFTEVVRNADFSGDYEVGSDDHHGTPAERVEAVRVGIAYASPARCEQTYDSE